MFSQASDSQGISRVFSGVHIIGGVDIDCNNLISQRLPDLKTKGGAFFGGSVAIMGDMCISGTLTGNVGGNLSGNLMGDISVEGDLDIGGNLTVMDGIISNLETDILCVNEELFVDFISPKDGTVINIANIQLEGNIIPEQDLTYDLGSPTHKFKTIYTDDIVICGSVSGNLNIDLSNVTSLTLETLTSNVITANTGCFDNIKATSANIQTIFVKDLCGFSPIRVTDDLTPDPGLNLGNAKKISKLH